MQNNSPTYYRNTSLNDDDLKDIFDEQYMCRQSTIITNTAANGLYAAISNYIRKNPIKSAFFSFICGIVTFRLYNKY